MRQRATRSGKNKNSKSGPSLRSHSTKDRKGKKEIPDKSVQKQYTKFNSSLLDQHDHFKTYFQEDKNDKSKFLCIACQEKNHDPSGYYDHISSHLVTKKHKEATKCTEDEIQDALAQYQDFRSRKKKKVVQISKETTNKLRIEYTAFALKHELSFNLIPDLIKFNQQILANLEKMPYRAFLCARLLQPKSPKKVFARHSKNKFMKT